MGSEIPPLAGEDHACAECGIEYPMLEPAIAGTAIERIPERARTALRAVAVPRRRPAPSAWSALEYLCHLRDVYVSSTIRLYRVRTEDTPVLEPMLNGLRAARLGYNELDPDPVLDELYLCVGGFLDEMALIRSDGWDRTAYRLPGEVRTARWLVRNAAHEGVHHVMDIERLGTEPS